MHCRGIECDKAGLCEKILFSNFLTFSQYIDSVCHYSTALAGVARCHPTQADLSCFDSLSHRLFAGENPEARKTDSEDNSSLASNTDSRLFRRHEHLCKKVCGVTVQVSYKI